uniref:Small monomeric GTPase n=1 Tax=Arcella intermedia TaxID=1963864 RepID=A0A6B2LU99_9EUKA
MGSGGIGTKTATVSYLTTNQFLGKYDPTIEDRYQVNMAVGNESYQLNIMDTAGQETFSAMRELYFTNCDGFLFVKSVRRQERMWWKCFGSWLV